MKYEDYETANEMGWLNNAELADYIIRLISEREGMTYEHAMILIVAVADTITYSPASEQN